MTTRKYAPRRTEKRIENDRRFIEIEAQKHNPALDTHGDIMTIRIKVPYDSDGDPEAVLKAIFNGSYDILRRGAQ